MGWRDAPAVVVAAAAGRRSGWYASPLRSELAPLLTEMTLAAIAAV